MKGGEWVECQNDQTSGPKPQRKRENGRKTVTGEMKIGVSNWGVWKSLIKFWRYTKPRNNWWLCRRLSSGFHHQMKTTTTLWPSLLSLLTTSLDCFVLFPNWPTHPQEIRVVAFFTTIIDNLITLTICRNEFSNFYFNFMLPVYYYKISTDSLWFCSRKAYHYDL